MKLSLLTPVVCAVTAAAQTGASPEAERSPELSTDRPGFGSAPQVLRRGLMQIEGGLAVTLETAGAARRQTVALGSPLLRFGAGGRSEFRITGDGVLMRGGSAGRADLTIGGKFAIREETRRLPAVSLMPSLSTPSGARALSSGGYDPGVGAALGKSLTAKLAAGATVVCGARTEHGARRYQQSVAVSLGAALPDGFAAYLEFYEVWPGGGSTPVKLSDGGFTRAIGGNMQIDVHAGRTLSGGPPGWFASAGFAVRRALH